jgi:H+/Cl- antiporter ClcA
VWEGIPESGAAWLRTQPLNETYLRLLVVPFGGGVLVGLLNTMRQSLANDTENVKSKSTWVSDLRGVLRAFLKAVGAAVTLGTGCSLGPEGPSVEIGASIANGVGTMLSNSRERKLSLVAAGSAAGISSGFTPLLASTNIRLFSF